MTGAIQNYEVTLCATPGDLTTAQREACVAIIRSGGAVHPKAAARELRRAAMLAIATRGDEIVGVGAIKRLRPDYAAGIAKRSRIPLDPETAELGYVAVDDKHQGQRLSPRIVAALLAKHVGPLFATTDNERMKRTLKKAGFVQKGQEWDGERGRLSLWIKD